MTISTDHPLQQLVELMTPRPISEYHEDMGSVLWWKFPIDGPPYVGTPNDCGFTVKVETKVTTYNGAQFTSVPNFDVGGWPGYHTHFTPIPTPAVPK
jgi:hypothetical protein